MENFSSTLRVQLIRVKHKQTTLNSAVWISYSDAGGKHQEFKCRQFFHGYKSGTDGWKTLNSLFASCLYQWEKFSVCSFTLQKKVYNCHQQQNRKQQQWERENVHAKKSCNQEQLSKIFSQSQSNIYFHHTHLPATHQRAIYGSLLCSGGFGWLLERAKCHSICWLDSSLIPKMTRWWWWLWHAAECK